MAYHREVLAERRVRAEGRPEDAISAVERALNVLDRFGRDPVLALLGLRLSPRLLRSAYLRFRPA